ncbi:MAG TPA: hypothetical protein VFJ13_05335 [Paracoccaceae bacterium]|nr:hypothetical protein [Paracoccaceae bacterium]
MAAAEMLEEVLAPVRESAISALLTAQARAIEAGAEIESEPVRRDPAGKVKRQGRLSLPSRGDLSVTMDNRTLIQRIEARRVTAFPPMEVRTQSGFTGLIGPFRWEDAEIRFETRGTRPNWTPIRLWFLEWFQPRHTRLQPELAGVVHSLEGPDDQDGSWQLHLDFGSAPIAAVASLIENAGETGCTRLTIGQIGV